MKHLVLILMFLSICPSKGRAVVPSDCWSMRKHGSHMKSQNCFEALTHHSEPYDRAEGFWGLEEWEQANEQFRLAAQASDNALYKVRWGMLLHERFNNPEAAELFREALVKDPGNAEAYIGLAVVAVDEFDGKAVEYLAKAIELEPKSVEAHELMADLALQNDDRTVATAEADKAIALADDAVDAMAIHAAVEVIEGRSPDAWFSKINSINPKYGEAYARVARQLELHYRYEDAVTYYRKAVELNPQFWAAHSALGIDLMRLGKEDEPRKELELSYDHGYRNAATVNSLRLLDSYKDFETFQDDAIILKLKKAEANLLQPYMQPELHNILSTYEKKYQIKLPDRVQVEVYSNHEDFAVRTTGMPGLGALGVTFGEVVAMDSPSARKPGDFNWGATLWHEMSHVYILTATHHRVPRWFTEGLAVHEEGEHLPEWSVRVTPDILIAIRDRKLLPVLKLDRGFVYPEYPSQVAVSYFQAGTICDFIKTRWGEGRLLAMIHAYAVNQSTSEVVKQVIGMEPEEFDRQYLAWINQKYDAEASQFDNWRQKLKTLAIATQQKQYDTVLSQGPEVLAMFPEYVGEANAYELIAEAYRAKADAKGESAVLIRYEREGGQNPTVLKRLATLEVADGHQAEAIATLERLNYIYPVKDEELHQKLGELLYGQKQYDRAVREYQAVVASNPLDKAGAQFHLAQAYLAAGQKDKAEESVLMALEVAPDYRPAQKLLLELNQASPK